MGKALGSGKAVLKCRCVVVNYEYFGRQIYRRILVYIFCLISIGLSLSDEVNKMRFLNIERA